MNAELARLNQWIRGQLIGDPTIAAVTGGRIFADEAPQNSPVPMVLFAFMGGADKVITGSSRLSNALYLIRAVDAGESYDQVSTVADRIEASMVLPATGYTLDGVLITSINREQPHQRKDAQYGMPTVYMGGFYRIHFQPAP